METSLLSCATASPSSRGIHSQVRWPSASETGARGLVWNDPVRHLVGFDEAHFSPAVHNEAVRRFIAILLPLRCPTTILRGIRSVVVDAVDRMVPARPWPHVLKKSVERLPAVAHCNAPASVQRVGGVPLIVAPPHYSAPYLVFRRSRAAMSCVHFAETWPYKLSHETPARGRRAVSEAGRMRSAHLATITQAIPSNGLSLVRSATNYAKPPEVHAFEFRCPCRHSESPAAIGSLGRVCRNPEATSQGAR